MSFGANASKTPQIITEPALWGEGSISIKDTNLFTVVYVMLARMSADIDPKRSLFESVARVGEMHLEIERQFLEFESIVPYKYNALIADCLYSPRLYNLLQGISSAIDAMFKILIPRFGLSVARYEFPECFKALNTKGMLTIQAVIVRNSLARIEPFAFPKDKDAPIWWTAYNKTKHQLASGGARNATLGNTIQALAGLVILLHISRELTRATQYLPAGLLDSKNWKDNSKGYQEAYEDLRYEEWLRWPLPPDDRHEKYLVSKDHDFRSKVFYYAMALTPAKSSLNSDDSLGSSI